MNTKQPYRKWVGVLMGFYFSGAAHFLSGKRSAGIKWFFGLFFCDLIALYILAIPGISTIIIGIAIILASIVLWVVMLKQSYRPVPRIGYQGWIWFIIVVVAMSYSQRFLIKQVVRPFRMPSSSMAPTIAPGDHVFVERLSCRFSKPKRGDIVAFKTDGIISLQPGVVYIKRIVGLPSDHIRIDPPYIFINGQKVLEPEIFAKISNESDGYSGFQLGGQLSSSELEWIMEEDEYFVLGDNTTNSRDSRYWGSVPAKNIIGKVTRIYWPFTRINAL